MPGQDCAILGVHTSSLGTITAEDQLRQSTATQRRLDESTSCYILARFWIWLSWFESRSPSQSFQSLIFVTQFVSPEEHDEGSRANRISGGADGFHGFTSAAGVHLLQHVVDVIAHRKLRKIQVRSDLFVCETFGDERDQLLLAQGKIGFRW